MKTTVTALTSVLLALALTGTAAGTLSEIELPEQSVPMGGVNGQAIGCDLSGEGFISGYGEAGVPSSSGYGDGTCDTFGYDNTGSIAYTVLKGSSGYQRTNAYGGSFFTGYASLYVYCPEPATVLVDWTGDEPAATYLTGSDCIMSKTGDLEFDDVEWYAFGYGIDNAKYAHTDNLADALVHLLA